MPVYYTPGVYYKKLDTGKEKISGLRTDIPGFVGIAEKGLLNTPIRIESWKQFQSVFGTFIPQSYLAYAVNGFFENGGDTCYVTRIADLGKAKNAKAILFDKTSETTSLAASVNAGATEIELTMIGSIVQGDYIRLKNDEQYYQVTAAPSGLKISISPTLKYAYTAGTTITKMIPTIEIQAINPGQWGNKIKVSLRESCMATTITADASLQPASKTHSVVKSVGGFEKDTLVKVFQNKSGTKVEKYHRVKSVETATRRIVWQVALEVDFDLTQPIYFSTMEFTLVCSLGTNIREIIENLSIFPDHSRYCGDIVNEKEASNLIRVKNMNSPSADHEKIPDPQKIVRDYMYLKDGVDGISSIVVDDFIGDPTTNERKGLRTFEQVDDVCMVCIPDIMIQPVDIELVTPSEEPDPCAPVQETVIITGNEKQESCPVFTNYDIERVQQAMIEHCELLKDRVVILDPPFKQDVSEILEWRKKFDTNYAAIYYPWIVVNDPLRLKGNITRLIPGSGHIAGVYARTDLTKGVHKAPANEDVLTAEDVAREINDAQQDILNPWGINCLRTFSGRGVLIWGARTVSSDRAWRFINIRRLLIMIEESIEEAMHWAVFEPNTVHLRNGIIVAVSSFLEDLWRDGALAGKTQSEAFRVKCDEENNPQSVIDAGRIITEIGVAPSIPGEFIIFQIGKVKDRIEIIKEGV